MLRYVLRSEDDRTPKSSDTSNKTKAERPGWDWVNTIRLLAETLRSAEKKGFDVWPTTQAERR